MIVPNKFLKLEETPLGKIKFIVAACDDEKPIAISDLFNKVSKKFDSIEEFVYALDILFLAKKIIWTSERSVIAYVK